ncbi:hypothetical protein ACLESO_34035 [Pyxidicoccus sp. 3LG]
MNRPSWRWGVLFAVVGLAACNAGEPMPGEDDSSGISVSPEFEVTQMCVCGTTRYTSTRYGEGATCGAAATQARNLLNLSMQSRCPAGTCNATITPGECVELGPSRTDGFRMGYSATYSCCG